MRGEIRKKERILSLEDTLALITKAEYGVLATVNPEGQPCTTALNHVYTDGVFYFHCGLKGERLDNIALNSQVSFFIVGTADVIYDQFTTAFSSAAIHGTIQRVEDPDEKLQALTALVERFSSEVIPEKVKQEFIAAGVHGVTILKLVPEHVTGKGRLSLKRPCLVY